MFILLFSGLLWCFVHSRRCRISAKKSVCPDFVEPFSIISWVHVQSIDFNWKSLKFLFFQIPIAQKYLHMWTVLLHMFFHVPGPFFGHLFVSGNQEQSLGDLLCTVVPDDSGLWSLELWNGSFGESSMIDYIHDWTHVFAINIFMFIDTHSEYIYICRYICTDTFMCLTWRNKSMCVASIYRLTICFCCVCHVFVFNTSFQPLRT